MKVLFNPSTVFERYNGGWTKGKIKTLHEYAQFPKENQEKINNLLAEVMALVNI